MGKHSDASRRIMFVHSIVDDARLSLAAFRVLGHLARRDGYISSITKIAEICGVSRRTAMRSVKELEAQKLLIVVRGKGHFNRYQIPTASEPQLVTPETLPIAQLVTPETLPNIPAHPVDPNPDPNSPDKTSDTGDPSGTSDTTATSIPSVTGDTTAPGVVSLVSPPSKGDPLRRSFKEKSIKRNSADAGPINPPLVAIERRLLGIFRKGIPAPAREILAENLGILENFSADEWDTVARGQKAKKAIGVEDYRPRSVVTFLTDPEKGLSLYAEYLDNLSNPKRPNGSKPTQLDRERERGDIQQKINIPIRVRK